MGKRKITNAPNLWKVGNLYLFPLSHDQYPSVEYKKFRQLFPDTQVFFLKNAVCPIQAILVELLNPYEFKEKDSHYYILPARTVMDANLQTGQVGKYQLTWIDDHIECLGSPICNECFVSGQLYPHTCPQHLHCQHGKKRVKTCDACISHTLLGFWKNRIAYYQGIYEDLFTIAAQSRKQCSFKCFDCKHVFVKGAPDITHGKWCPFCTYSKLCGDIACQLCVNKSFARHERSQYWSEEKNGQLLPHKVCYSSSIKYWFRCDVCQHSFLKAISNITAGDSWCSFCGHKQLCDETACQFCYNNSFASHEKSIHWDKAKNAQIVPREVFRSAGKKYWFNCNRCMHSFELQLNQVVAGYWCYFCTHHRLCEIPLCHMCFDNSFASHEKSQYWDTTLNDSVVPRNVFRFAEKKYWFKCELCSHSFDSTLYNISHAGNWCPYCAHRQLCGDSKCETCWKNSFQSHPKSVFWVQSRNTLTPRQVFAKVNTKYWFTCTKCKHDFDMSLDFVSSGTWCPFCAHRQRCDKLSCTSCAQSCDVCKMRRARTQTRVSRTWVCRPCLDDAIMRDPNEQPLMQRAKISLEIFMLAELQRHAMLTHDWFINQPTTWDCAIFPTLSFKPDVIWCFDEFNDVIELGNATKLNLNAIKYALQFEIIEESRVTHSKARHIPDEERERQIRGLLSSQRIPLGFLYATVAHNKHFNAHPDDVFFKKVNQEYEVMPDKMQAWMDRIQGIRLALLKMVEEHSNETVYIGH